MTVVVALISHHLQDFAAHGFVLALAGTLTDDVAAL